MFLISACSRWRNFWSRLGQSCFFFLFENLEMTKYKVYEVDTNHWIPKGTEKKWLNRLTNRRCLKDTNQRFNYVVSNEVIVIWYLSIYMSEVLRMLWKFDFQIKKVKCFSVVVRISNTNQIIDTLFFTISINDDLVV